MPDSLRKRSAEVRGPDGEQGDVGNLALPELLAGLHTERASGELEVYFRRTTASLWMVDGELHDAHLHPHRGLAALDRLLELQRGQYRFKPGSQSLRRSLFDAFAPMLAGHAQREAKRAALIRRLLVTNLSLVVDREVLGDAHLDPADDRCQLLQLVDGRRTASQVVEQSQLPPAEALRDLADWYDLGVLKPIGDEAMPIPVTRRGPALAGSSSPPSNGSAETNDSGFTHAVHPADITPKHRRTERAAEGSTSGPLAPSLLSSPSARTVPEVPAARVPRSQLPQAAHADTGQSRPEADKAVDLPSSKANQRRDLLRTLIAFPSPWTTSAAVASDASPGPPTTETPRERPPTSAPASQSVAGDDFERRSRFNSRTLLGFPTMVPLNQAPSASAHQPSTPQTAEEGSNSTGTPPLTIEEQLAAFDKSTCLARGRDSAVYLVARAETLSVFKVPRTGSPAQQRKLQDEARLLRLLRHDSIVALREAADRGSSPYLLMEYVDGLTLAEILRAAQPLSLDVALGILHDLFCALDYLHHVELEGGTGLLHGNLEPHNILVGFDGQTRLIDFGEARPCGTRNDGTDTHAEARFSSPEALAGDAVHATSDIYSLGILMQELARSFPTVGAVTETKAFIEAARRAASAQPLQRYQTVTDLALALRITVTANPHRDVLRAWLRHLPQAASSQRPSQRLRGPVADLSPVVQPDFATSHQPQALPQPPALSTTILLAVTLALLTALGVAVYLYIDAT